MSVLYFLALVGVLVTVHELGHFIAAKLCGVKVLRFSLGFGPAIARVRGRETEYQIGIVPLGGYVRMLGEDPGDAISEDDQERSFSLKPLWKRLVVVFAGPAANLLCPIIIYFAFFLGHHELPAAVVGDVFPDGPAAAAGIQPGDRILEINGAPVRYWEELESIVDTQAGKMLRFKIQRGTESLFTYVAPRPHTIRTRDGSSTEQALIGITQAPFSPTIGVLDAASPAARAGLKTGDRIISVDGHPVRSFTELTKALGPRARRHQLAYLRADLVDRDGQHGLGFADVKMLSAPKPADVIPDADGATGIASSEFFISSVEPGSPADRAGIQPGDLITQLDGQPVVHWMLFDQALLGEPDRTWRIDWLRAIPGGGTEPHEAIVQQEHRKITDEYGQKHDQLVFGAANDFRLGEGEMAPIDNRFVYAAGHSLDRTGSTIVAMARGLSQLIRGKLPRDTVGGPIMMYRMASVSGAKGWDAFLLMIALISINLGLINLLPIPILDGGNVVMFAIEGIRRRRLSTRVREAIVLTGLVMIVSLTILALRNDIVRYFIH